MKGKTHLSYGEILIIAAILGVVARTTVPQFTEATTETKVSELIDGLETMRSHLDLYRAHHGDCLPACNSSDSFEAAMTTKAGRYEPHIKKIPVNPFNNLNTVRFDGEPAGADRAGWRLDTKTGLFQADNNNAAYVSL